MTVSIDATAGSEALKVGGVEAVPFDVNGLKIGAFNDGVITPVKLAQPLTAGTAVATTSGTAIDFTGIPSWVKKITIMLFKVSSSGISSFIIRIGDSGGIEATGYESTAIRLDGGGNGMSNSTTDFIITANTQASDTYSGAIVLTLEDASNFKWTAHGNLAFTNRILVSAGGKALSSTLTQLRLTTSGGTDTFDAGSINIMYE